MPFATFEGLYAALSILAASTAIWNAHRKRRDLLVLIGMTVVMAVLFFAMYVDAKTDDHAGSLSEALFRAFTHMRRDAVLTLCNVLLWGTVPFSIGLKLRKYRYGSLLVWVCFAAFTGFKTWFEDLFIIHSHPELFQYYPFDWEYFMASWLVVYGIAALVITKGLDDADSSEGWKPS
jgi:hypothetical protein